MSKQRFNHKTLYTKTCVDNILRVFDNASEVQTDSNWYLDANRFAKGLADKYDVSLLKVCGIIAALSPLKPWYENKRIAESFLLNGNAFHTNIFRDKAKAILNCDGTQTTIADILKGNKITSFFLNIAYPENSNNVTIDRHALDIALGSVQQEQKRKMSVNQYEFFVNCYIIAANMRNITPSNMQSITWVKWREAKRENDNLPF